MACDGAPTARASTETPRAAQSAQPVAAPVVSGCPVFQGPEVVGTVLAPEVSEASGLAASRRNPGVLWAHNDSGGGPRLFALDGTGRLLKSFELPGASASDWEDIAVGPGKETSAPHLYIADIGDNRRRRKDGVVLHRVPEPALDPSEPAPKQAAFLGPRETFRIRYPDGPEDAETLLVEPRTGEVVVITKTLFQAPRVFYVPSLEGPRLTWRGGREIQLEAPGLGGFLPTGGDVSPDGAWVILRSYHTAYLWRRKTARPLHETFEAAPCSVPLAEEPQGEAIGFAADGRSYFTLSEGQRQPLHRYRAAP